MVMPPFAPPPYMESQAYILPHPHMQPVDYRRFLHPQVHAPGAPYQNPNHARRIRLPNTAPVRETVNSAVQTEPTPRHVAGYTDGSPPIRSDSGHGTASNSPSSSSSSSQKQGTAEVENYASTDDKARTKSAGTNGTGKHALNILISHPTQIKSIQSGIRAGVATQKFRNDSVGQENIPPYKNAHCNMWSVGSSDSITPVCSSSQQEEEAVKERRISFPDILMSWVGGTPQATLQTETEKVLGQDAKQLPSFENKVEQENSDCQSPKEVKTDGAPNEKGRADDAEILYGSNELSHSTRTTRLVGLISSIRQSLAFTDEQLPSPDKSLTLSDPDRERAEANSPKEPTEVIPYEIVLNSCQTKRKMNESVWSVESLCPFIPSKEWVHQKSNLEPEIIVETTEEPEDGPSTPNGELDFKSDKERRQSSRFSSSDFVPLSDSWLVYSTPGEKPLTVNKRLELEHKTDASVVRELEQGFIMTPAEMNPSVPLTSLQHGNVLLMLTTRGADENRSSEADGSPNQESVAENGQQERSSCPPQQKRSPPLSSAAGDKSGPTSEPILQNTADRDIVAGPCENKETSTLGTEKRCAPVSEQRMVGLSPSKGHLVDFGVQCSKLLPCSKDCCEEPLRRHPIKYSGSALLLFFLFVQDRS